MERILSKVSDKGESCCLEGGDFALVVWTFLATVVEVTDEALLLFGMEALSMSSGICWSAFGVAVLTDFAAFCCCWFCCFVVLLDFVLLTAF